jgi:uncharacterized protein YbjT (DUF2867 family)
MSSFVPLGSRVRRQLFVVEQRISITDGDLTADNLGRNAYLVGATPDGHFETAVPTGRVPFVASEDIARGALKAITEDIINKDLVVLGPELLTYDEVRAYQR